MPPITNESELGPYRIVRPLPALGKDGLVESWLAELPEKQQEVTLNILRIPHRALSEEDQRAYALFRNEVEVLKRLRHLNVVRIYPLSPGAASLQGESYLSKMETGGESWWFWAMEHLEGGSLDAKIGRGRLPVAEAAEIVFQVAAALDYIHSKGIAHLHVEPRSVFFRHSLEGLNPRVELVLTGFGSATRIDGEPSLGQPSAEQQVELPSMAYQSPERIRRKVGPQPADHRPSDVYSLGILFYHLLAGEVPFSGTEEDMQRAIFASEFTPLPRFDVPREVEDLIFQCLRKNSSERPTTEELLTTLDKAVPPPRKVRTGAEIPAATVPGPEAAAAEKERRGEEPSLSFFQRLRRRLFARAPGTPKLLVPEDEATLEGRVVFAWDWDGELKKGQAFELRMWKEDQSHDRVGELQKELEVEIDLDAVVPELPGEEPDCFWSVAVVRESPYGSVTEEAEPRSFRFGPEAAEEGEAELEAEGEASVEETAEGETAAVYEGEEDKAYA